MKTFHRLNILDDAGSNRAMQKTTNFVVYYSIYIFGIPYSEIPPKKEKIEEKKRNRVWERRVVSMVTGLGLQGLEDTFVVMRILPYLTPGEILVFGFTSHRFQGLIKEDYLWNQYLSNDFRNAQVATSDNKFNLYRDLKLTFRNDVVNYVKDRDRNNHSKYTPIAKYVIDLMHIRLYTPLPTLTLIITIILFAIYVDGNNPTISIWICAVPLYFFFGYVLLLYLSGHCIHQYDTSRSVFRNLFENMASPIKFILKENARFQHVFKLVLSLLALQVTFICLKLWSKSHHIAGLNYDSFSWFAVFFPIWTMLVVGLIAVFPCSRVFNSEDYAGYIYFLVLLWLPCVIVLLCLAFKFESVDHPNDSSVNRGDYRLALIFIPFYLVESIILLIVLFYFVRNLRLWYYYKYVIHLEDMNGLNIAEHLSMLVSSWMLVIPLIVFQSLLAGAEDGRYQLTATQIIIPLLVFVSPFLCFSFIFSCCVRTPYQIEEMQTNIGTRSVFRV